MAKEPAGTKIADPSSSVMLKYSSLLILTFQNAILILSMRYTRVQEGPMYITTTAVVFSESLKTLICLGVIFYQKKNPADFFSYLYESLLVNWKDTLMLSVPSIVYMIQNNLQYVAVSNLEAAVFQVTYQLKILTTALFSVLILSKKLSSIQWGSLVLLFAGVALVQVQSISATSKSAQDQNQMVGLIAVIVSCLSSGFAGVYVEKMLKQTTATLWLRNVQLGMFGALTGLIGMFLKDWNEVSERGLLAGYTPLVWFVVCQQALGGLIVAIVVKYADNILKGFSTSLSIIISCVASVFLFSYVISLGFVIGSAFVMGAIYLYGRFPPPKTPVLPIVSPSSESKNQENPQK